jgi:hypothetical protein
MLGLRKSIQRKCTEEAEILRSLDYVRDVETSDKNKHCHYWFTPGRKSAAK